jgi:hypothetical protein
LMGQLLEQIQSMFPDYAYEAVSQAQEQDYINSQLEDNVASNVQFTVDDYLKGIDASDGISQDETKLAFDLLSTGAVTVGDLEAKTGIPASAIQSTYDTIAAANAAQAQADLAAEIAAADAEERRVTGMLNEFGETYAEEQARLALERSAANDAIMKKRADDAAALAAEAAARNAETQTAANSPEAAETQRKDDDFDTKVNAAGGVTPGTIGEVIKIALEVYGDDSRGVVKVISESLKGGVTMKDLEEATDLSGDEILEAAKTAANDPDKSLTPGEILSGAANTVYDITNKVVDIVETGLEVTGIEKVIDTIGNTVSKIVGLDPNQTQKVLVVNPVTGQVTVQASNQPQGGILGSLPQSPYVPIGTTSGGTTYGIDAENAIINVVLGKILTDGGLDQGDTKTIIGAAVEETLGIPMEVAVGVINSAEDLVKGAVKTVTNSGVLAGSGNRQDDEEAAAETTGFEVITGGEGNDTITGGTGNDTITGGTGNDTSTSATDGLMGPFQVDDDGNIILPSSSTSNTTLTLAPTVTANTPCPTPGDVRDPNTLVCSTPVVGPGPCPNEGDIRDKNGDCYTPGPGARTKIDEDLTVANITANTPCDNTDEVRDPVTLVCGKPTGGQTKVCPEGTKLARQTVDINTDCGTIGGQTKVCPKGTKLADQTVDINTDCGTIGGQTKVCPKGTKLADQTVDINTDCGTIGGQTKVCPEGTKLARQTVDINTDCGTIGGQTKVCPKGTKLADQTVDINTDCGTIGGQTKVCPKGTKLADQTVDINTDCGTINTVVDEDDDKTVVVDGVTNVVNYVCKEEGAVYNPVTEKCEKTNTTTLDTTVKEEVVCSDPDAVYDATLNNGQGGCFKTTTRTIDGANTLTQTVCETGTWDEALQKCVNTVTGDVINKTICKDGSDPDANGNCLVTTTLDTTTTTLCKDGQPPDPETGCARTIYMDTTTNTICPEESYKGEDGRCYNDVTGEVVQNNICPAGTTYNETSGQCEYSKYFCGPGFTFNVLTSQCEPDDEKEKETGGITTLPTPDLKVPGRGDFVTADDVLVENTGDVGGIYSILPAPVREPFLAGRRQQDIRNVADTVGIRQGQDFNQDPFAVERFARYANAFDVGTPELLDISGVLPGDFPAYEEKFNVQFPEFGIAPPVRPDEDLFPIAGARFDPTTYTPTAMAAGGVVERENGIESLMDRRQQAVNRMLIKRAGSYFGR